MAGTKRRAEGLLQPRRKSARTKTATSMPGFRGTSKLGSIECLDREEQSSLNYSGWVLDRYNEALPFIPESQLQISSTRERHNNIARIRNEISNLWASTNARLADLQWELRCEARSQQHSTFGFVRWYQRSNIMSKMIPMTLLG